MKATPQSDSLPGRLEADIEARIHSLFERCPGLCGFAVTSRAGLTKYADLYPVPEADLCVTDVGIYPDIDRQCEDIHDEIVCALADLVRERPYANDYLRDRTFARALH